jgi:histidinol dehydrogenase
MDGASAAASPSSKRIVPLDRVGCYVPGGRYPLPSSC